MQAWERWQKHMEFWWETTKEILTRDREPYTGESLPG